MTKALTHDSWLERTIGLVTVPAMNGVLVSKEGRCLATAHRFLTCRLSKLMTSRAKGISFFEAVRMLAYEEKATTVRILSSSGPGTLLHPPQCSVGCWRGA